MHPLVSHRKFPRFSTYKMSITLLKFQHARDGLTPPRHKITKNSPVTRHDIPRFFHPSREKNAPLPVVIPRFPSLGHSSRPGAWSIFLPGDFLVTRESSLALPGHPAVVPWWQRLHRPGVLPAARGQGRGISPAFPVPQKHYNSTTEALQKH